MGKSDHPDHPIELRIRAAMAFADLDFAGLAKRIDTSGLGARTLQKFVEPDDDREVRAHELRLIAEACEVPYWFLADGFGEESFGGTEGRIGQIEERLSGVERSLADVGDLAAKVAALEESSPSLGERLAKPRRPLTRPAGEPDQVQAQPAKSQDRGATKKRRQGGTAA
jgi:hypothetical protein